MKYNIQKIIRTFLSFVAMTFSILIMFKEIGDFSTEKTKFFIGILGGITGIVASFILIQLKSKQIKVFISYPYDKKEFIEKITKDLEVRNIYPINIEDKILVGDNIEEKIKNNIALSDYFIVLLSNKENKSDFLGKELDIAFNLNKRILPISYGDVSVPEKLSGIKYADFSKNYQSALNLLIKSMGKS